MDGTWPTYQRIQYNTMMLYHNIVNSDYKRVARKLFAEQTKSIFNNTVISNVQQIAQVLGVKRLKYEH